MSKIKTSRNRKTCSVFGCMNSNLQNPEMAFFSLPSDPQRLSTWLALIDRQDLANKPERHYRVCEIHFDRTSVLETSNRKVLKKNALPSLRLPNIGRRDKAVQATLRLPVVFKLRDHVKEVADVVSLDEADVVSEDASLYCDESTESRGHGSLYDAHGKAVARVHGGFQCNLCQSDIYGFRYTCVECADYDICASCEARGAHARHYVLRVPGPRPYEQTRSILSRIRRELKAGVPSVSGGMGDATDDSLKMEVKLEVEDPLEPGPDPLLPAEAAPVDITTAIPQADQSGSGQSVDTEPVKGESGDVGKQPGNPKKTTAIQNTTDETLPLPPKESNVPRKRHIEQQTDPPKDLDAESDVVPQKRQDLEFGGLSPEIQSPREIIDDAGFCFEVYTHTSNDNEQKKKNRKDSAGKKHKESAVESSTTKKVFGKRKEH